MPSEQWTTQSEKGTRRRRNDERSVVGRKISWDLPFSMVDQESDGIIECPPRYGGRKLPWQRLATKAGERGAECDNWENCPSTVFPQQARKCLPWNAETNVVLGCSLAPGMSVWLYCRGTTATKRWWIWDIVCRLAISSKPLTHYLSGEFTGIPWIPFMTLDVA